MLENIISEWIKCINEYYEVNGDVNDKYEVSNIDNQLRSEMLEFIEADKTLVLEQANTSIMPSHPQVQDQSNTSIIQSHSQAYYTSRKLTEIIVQSETECFESCVIKD
ncbi:unnamed protein product [Rhizophagus irregularis]|uniref:Uncharacterized protein n=1 Tax=Rhizophagus irregularis TaxID=588596 RepID=A0A915ZJN6_9GLOM|nr:unnamed protein product [Rhizophagus irregularis]